ncbi:MAG: hypothetical protein IT426_12685 [Pirellulales bacterium]|nr:hypothetical protein [Pirellulales bacterium]
MPRTTRVSLGGTLFHVLNRGVGRIPSGLSRPRSDSAYNQRFVPAAARMNHVHKTSI